MAPTPAQGAAVAAPAGACLAQRRLQHSGPLDGAERGDHVKCRPRGFISVLLFSVASMSVGVLVPAFAGVAAAASTKPSLDLCVVEPGFATPGDSFGLTTTGPKSFNNTVTLQASACGSYSSLPASGSYTVTQSQTPSGWQVGGIYCYSVGTANKANGTVDQSSSSATVNVTGPTSCIFAELQGGGGGFSGGSGKGSTPTTTKSGTSTTTTTTKKTVKPPIVSICQVNPNACKFNGNKI